MNIYDGAPVRTSRFPRSPEKAHWYKAAVGKNSQKIRIGVESSSESMLPCALNARNKAASIIITEKKKIADMRLVIFGNLFISARRTDGA